MSERYFPFHRLGLRGNPFQTLSDAAWAEVAIWPAALTAAVEEGFDHLQLLGQKGCGKTTTLLLLADHFARAGRPVAYEYIAEGQDHFTSDVRPLELFVLDEAQRLAAGERRRLLTLAARTQLIVSSHIDLTGHFRLRGLGLTTVRLDGLSGEPAVQHLDRLIQRRLDSFSLSPEPAITLSLAAAQYLNGEFGPNLRAAEQFLYEYFQHLAGQPEEAGGRIVAARRIEAAGLRQFRVRQGEMKRGG